MENDPSEDIRREMVDNINTVPNDRKALEDKHGQVWDTQQLANDFEILGFFAPFVLVKRRSDGVKGSLTFQHSPRYYFTFSQEI